MLENFKDNLIDYLRGLAWEHWTKMGIHGRVRAETTVNVDPEGLILLTSFLNRKDLRLLKVAEEWVARNESLIFKSRLKSILDVDHLQTLRGEKRFLFGVGEKTNTKYWTAYSRELPGDKNYSVEYKPHPSAPLTMSVKDEFFRGTQKNIDSNRVRLRRLFGTGTRAELLNFFLAGGKGSSKSISEYIHLSQSTVHSTLQDLVDLGVAEKRGRTRNTSYRLVKGSFALDCLSQEVFFDWPNYFRSIITAWKRLEGISQVDSNYKFRSVVNQFFQEFRENLSDWNIPAPSVTESYRPSELMKIKSPGERVLEAIKKLPDKVMDNSKLGSQ